MALTLYNTLTRNQETFEPLEPGKVQMYYCGVTVYDYCHLGHARACIVWDVVRRYLQWRGYDVQYVQNFTDIDDKILNRARQEGSSMEAVAERFIQAYFEDMARLNVKEADAYPRATHTIDGIKRLVYELEQKGYAYPVAGDVYYAVRKFAEYGKLSGRKLEDLQAGASGRVMNVSDRDPQALDPEAQKKKDPFDFALWKAAKPGEPSWESLWGAGRPGWHIECSAMVRACLGDTIDIHAGGADLIFPHHENEIAQSEAVTGVPLASYWLHNGMVTVDGEKMSKSLGNFITIRELLDRPTDPMAVRLFVLQAQYRKPIDFTDEAIAAATNGWNTLKEGLLFGYQHGKQLGWEMEIGDKRQKTGDRRQETGDRRQDNHSISPSPHLPISPSPHLPISRQSPQRGSHLRAEVPSVEPRGVEPPQAKRSPSPHSLLPEVLERFQETVDDDFNFPGGLAILFELAKELRREGNILVHQGKTETSPQQLEQQWHTLVSLAQVLGLEAQVESTNVSDGLSDAEIEIKIQQRHDARKAKNFAEADRIRNELQAQGITLIDSPDGVTRWHRN